jgi:hypothetical protein
MGFEPMVGSYAHTDLANRRFRPLSHLSGKNPIAGNPARWLEDFALSRSNRY